MLYLRRRIDLTICVGIITCYNLLRAVLIWVLRPSPPLGHNVCLGVGVVFVELKKEGKFEWGCSGTVEGGEFDFFFSNFPDLYGE